MWYQWGMVVERSHDKNAHEYGEHGGSGATPPSEPPRGGVGVRGGGAFAAAAVGTPPEPRVGARDGRPHAHFGGLSPFSFRSASTTSHRPILGPFKAVLLERHVLPAGWPHPLHGE